MFESQSLLSDAPLLTQTSLATIDIERALSKAEDALIAELQSGRIGPFRGWHMLSWPTNINTFTNLALKTEMGGKIVFHAVDLVTKRVCCVSS